MVMTAGVVTLSEVFARLAALTGCGRPEKQRTGDTMCFVQSKEGSYLGSMVATRALQMASQLLRAIMEHGSSVNRFSSKVAESCSTCARKLRAALRDHLSHDAGIAVDRQPCFLLYDPQTKSCAESRGGLVFVEDPPAVFRRECGVMYPEWLFLAQARHFDGGPASSSRLFVETLRDADGCES